VTGGREKKRPGTRVQGPVNVEYVSLRAKRGNLL
jgi:hypothetical protein